MSIRANGPVSRRQPHDGTVAHATDKARIVLWAAESTGTMTVAVPENARMANPLWACVIAAHWNSRHWSCLDWLGLGLIVIH
ncbi:uncharacterized protein An02g05810 [Aspergillus niger]|uniref:Contig An02c0160, genomic contig n=2 Tax=Aspergillus niger TaxID=5061 RepID=A2QD47_ASPNC|nr:uncharacterized protein An02g05810 [Aspergillus niger]CAK47709.1 unnamed protein product [Aspergillus niger]